MGSERLSGTLLERLTHHVHILEANGESYRLRQSRGKVAKDGPSSLGKESSQEGIDFRRAGG